MQDAATAARTCKIVILMLIGGTWRDAAESCDARDPFHGDVVSVAPRSALRDMTEERLVVFNA